MRETPTAKVKCQMLILRAAGRAVEGDLLHEDLSQPCLLRGSGWLVRLVETGLGWGGHWEENESLAL